jgi:hypothetical protein
VNASTGLHARTTVYPDRASWLAARGGGLGASEAAQLAYAARCQIVLCDLIKEFPPGRLANNVMSLLWDAKHGIQDEALRWKGRNEIQEGR